jgi:hypothetical protein
MKTLRYLLAASMLLGAHAVLAQAPTAANMSATKPGNHAQSNGEIATAKNSVPCQHIITECKKLGYIVGQAKTDNGLWMDCFNPVVKGGKPTRDGAQVTVPVSPTDVQACRAAVFPNGVPAKG